jgi:hypothetical protein
MIFFFAAAGTAFLAAMGFLVHGRPGAAFRFLFGVPRSS